MLCWGSSRTGCRRLHLTVPRQRLASEPLPCETSKVRPPRPLSKSRAASRAHAASSAGARCGSGRGAAPLCAPPVPGAAATARLGGLVEMVLGHEPTASEHGPVVRATSPRPARPGSHLVHGALVLTADARRTASLPLRCPRTFSPVGDAPFWLRSCLIYRHMVFQPSDRMFLARIPSVDSAENTYFRWVLGTVGPPTVS